MNKLVNDQEKINLNIEVSVNDFPKRPETPPSPNMRIKSVKTEKLPKGVSLHGSKDQGASTSKKVLG